MPENSRPLPRSVWLGCSLAFSLIGLAVVASMLQNARRQQAPLPVIGPVADFTLTNQDGKVATLADLTNHVWIADIIFTRCAGPCPRLTMQMKTLQEKIPANGATRFVTLTTDPAYDSPEVLKKIGLHYGADFSRWNFLTGTKAEIAGLAAGSLKLSAQPVKPEEQKDAADLFIHTTIFVIVDKHAQLRGFFETGGEDVDWTNAVLPKIIGTVNQLEGEP
ncbi:MAG TPA: SCO family protein [Candidatus Acidoferrales bacterium]|jgi:protein SCO1/2|nr:SCO family protein [Candidatus Acidoferrales bacterium]